VVGGAEILGVGRALPPHHASQDQLIAALREVWAARHYNPDRLEQLHRAVRVSGRYLALPLDEYRRLDSFGKANDAFVRVSLELGEQAVRRALDVAGLGPGDVDHLIFTTITGVACPSLDARLVNRLGLPRHLRRTPSFGLGCVAGAVCLSRAADAVQPRPHEVAVVLSVELCSLTLQREDVSISNLIGTGLFGDGAAAVVVGGPARPPRGGPRIVASRSVFYPNTEDTMGWDVVDSGFRLVLNAKVPVLAREHLRGDVDAFLADHGLARRDVKHWVCHPGGPKVLQAIEEALELPPEATARSWRSLEEVGNLSSASVLFILGDHLAEADPRPGDLGVLLAMGPGFSSELLLLRW
jgi:alkylresorcinol/alkylpyrone synthase